MPDMKFLRDVVVGSRNQAMKQDPAEELMRLSQDPLLLHAYLQPHERDKPDPVSTATDVRLSAQLQSLGERHFDRRAKDHVSAATARYSLRELLFEPSLHPEAFGATAEDKEMAIEEEALHAADVMPPNLVGGIVIACGIVLIAVSIADVLAIRWIN
jgi:hypothetical protein